MAFKAGSIYGEARLDDKKWNSGLKRITKGAALAGAAIAAAFAAAFVLSVKAADKFQKAMANVSTLVDTAIVDMQKLSKAVLLLPPALGETTDLTKGLYQAFSAGATTAKEAMKITVDSAKFAKAALTDTFTAVDVLTTAVNAYGKETMDTTKASDIFFQTIKFGKITGEQLAASIGTSIPLYASVGIELEELTSGLAAMTKQGVDANLATTQLNAIVNAFLKPSVAMTEALQNMGYESGSTFLKAEGLAGALKLIETQTDGDAAAMSDLLPNIRALRGAMALTGVGGEEFNRVLGEMENATGVTEEAFAKQEKTFDTYKNSLKKVQIVVGNMGKHFVDKLAVGATTAAEGMLAFIMSSQGMELVANIVGTVAGGFELSKGIIMPIVDVLLPVLNDLWITIKENLVKVTGESTSGAGAFKILSISINLVSSGITVLGKVLVGTINLMGNLIRATVETTKSLGIFFKFLVGKATLEEVLDQSEKVSSAFKNLGKDLVSDIGEIWKTVRDEARTFSGETEELATNLSIKVKTAVENSSDYIKNTWGELTTGQQDFIGDILAGMDQLSLGIKTKTKGGTEDTAQTWSEHWDEQIETVQLAYDTINSIISTSFEGLSSIRSQYFENQDAELQLWYQSELSSLQQNLDNKIITEEQFNAEKEKLDKDMKDKKNKLGRDAFEADKKNKIFGVLSNAASAIMGWWAAASSLGPIIGPIFASAMTILNGVISAAQIAAISASKFVPAMEKGGTASGLTRIGEHGGEILNLPDNTIVIPNDISREIARAGGSSSSVINVSFDGANISNEMDLDHVTDVIIKKLGKEMRLVV